MSKSDFTQNKYNCILISLFLVDNFGYYLLGLKTKNIIKNGNGLMFELK